MSKRSVYLNITKIGRLITIWDEVFCKLRVSVDGMAIKNKIFLDYSHFIEKNIDVVEEYLEFQISVSFELCIDEEFI